MTDTATTLPTTLNAAHQEINSPDLRHDGEKEVTDELTPAAAPAVPAAPGDEPVHFDRISWQQEFPDDRSCRLGFLREGAFDSPTDRFEAHLHKSLCIPQFRVARSWWDEEAPGFPSFPNTGKILPWSPLGRTALLEHFQKNPVTREGIRMALDGLIADARAAQDSRKPTPSRTTSALRSLQPFLESFRER